MTNWKYWTKDNTDTVVETAWTSSSTDLPINTLLFKDDFVQQFHDMIIDVSLLMNFDYDNTTLYLNRGSLAVGDDITDQSSDYITIRAMQGVINELLRRVHPDINQFFILSSSADVVGQATATYVTGDDVLTNAGLPALPVLYSAGLSSGFFQPRRTQIHPSDPAFVSFSNGMAQSGDIVGGWIFEDLRRVGEQLNMILLQINADNNLNSMTGSANTRKFKSIAYGPNVGRSWSTEPWSTGAALSSISNGNSEHDAGAFGLGVATVSFGLNYSSFYSPSWQGHAINWNLLVYPFAQDFLGTSGTHQWSIGVPYNLYSSRNTGQATTWGNIDMGLLLDYTAISPPYDSYASPSATAYFHCNGRFPPSVGSLPIANRYGAYVILEAVKL